MDLISIKLRMVLQFLVLGGLLMFTIKNFWWVAPNTLNNESKDLDKVEPPTISQNFQGVVLNVRTDCFNHTKSMLEHLDIRITQQKPLKYNNLEVDQELEKFQGGSRKYHTDEYLKVFSKRMAFIFAMQAFANDVLVDWNSWRFFFEDDISLHPSLTPDQAKEILANGLALAEDDGVVYLGICGPHCVEPVEPLGYGYDAERCSGACAHAFGFRRWKASQFLLHMDNLVIESPDPHVESMYFDRLLVAYALQVHRIWVIGSNLQSPTKDGYDHYGILFQDRDTFNSSIED
jgi:hypothetical protein